MSVLLDTHVWIWWLRGDQGLPARERTALDALAAEGIRPLLAAMSLWEAQMLHSKARLVLDVPFEDWLRQAAHPDVVRLLPLDVSVVLALDTLPTGFHGDPADRLIVATARAHGLALLTHDGAIRSSGAVALWSG